MGDNNNNKDCLCHYSYANNSYGVLRGASGRNKYPPAFILQKTESSGQFLFSPLCFSEKWSVGGGGWGGSFLRGRLRVRAGVKSKCVIVTKLMRKSRGGQCADRTLGCMIHRRGLNTNPLDPRLPFPSTSPAPEIPTVSLHYGTNTKVMANHLTSPLVWATPSIWS